MAYTITQCLCVSVCHVRVFCHNKQRTYILSNWIVCTGKAELKPKLLIIKKLHSLYCTVKTNYRNTQSIVRPLCDSRASCNNGLTDDTDLMYLNLVPWGSGDPLEVIQFWFSPVKFQIPVKFIQIWWIAIWSRFVFSSWTCFNSAFLFVYCLTVTTIWTQRYYMPQFFKRKLRRSVVPEKSLLYSKIHCPVKKHGLMSVALRLLY